MKNLIFNTITLLLLCFSGHLNAQSAQLSVQGVLRNANGTSIENGKFEITFRLWDAASGGNEIWSENMTDVDVEGGVYSVILGGASTILDAPFDRPYFLGVTIEDGTELIPRASLTSSPYALSLIGSDNIFPNSGNVGIGDANPNYKLSLRNDSGQMAFNPSDHAYTSLFSQKADGLEFYNNTNGKGFIFSGGDGERMRIAPNGHVGIGLSDPQKLLHLRGDGEMLLLDGPSTAGLNFRKTGMLPSEKGAIGFLDGSNNNMTMTNLAGGRLFISAPGNVVEVSNDFDVNGKVDVFRNGGGLRLVGNDHFFTEYYPKGEGAGRKAQVGFNTPGTDDFSIVNESGGDIFLEPSSGEVIIDGYLYVGGNSKSVQLNDYDYWTEVNGIQENQGSGTHALSIYADQGIRALTFYADSDRRIKKDFRISNGMEDLATLKKIEVTDYRYIDAVKEGSDFRKGLLAQQIAEVFPEAINKTVSTIPSIYEFPAQLSVQDQVATFTTSKPHQLKPGDKVQMITDDGEAFFNVAQVSDQHSFTVNEWTGSSAKKEVFIYGKEVDDFHTVDYDRVFTLAVSATQELARKIEALEKENAQLLQEKENTTALLNDLKDIKERMKAVENLFTTTGSK